MYTKKLLSVLAIIIGALLIIKALFVITMYAWSFFGQPPVMIFNPGASTTVNILLFVQELGTLAFIYLVVGFIKTLLCGHMCEMANPSKIVKAATSAVKKAKKTVRKVAKKK